MKYDKNKTYTGDELEALVEEAKAYGSDGARKRLEKDFVPKSDYETLKGEKDTLHKTVKEKDFNIAFSKVASTYGITEKKQSAIIKLADVSLDDAPEAIDKKVKSLKVDYPELFESKELNPGGGSFVPPKAKDKDSESSQEDVLNPRRR